MQRFRILLHSMTFSRDYTMMSVLSRLLEGMGHECFIASNESHVSKIAKLWNPHAIFFITASSFKELRPAYPKATFFYCAAEGGEDYANFDEKFFIQNNAALDSTEHIFLWGDHTKKMIDRYVYENFQEGDQQSLNELLDRKISIVGHPRLDLIHFGIKQQRQKNGKINVGLIGNFWSINKYGVPALAHLFNDFTANPQEPTIQGNIESTMELCRCYVDIITRLPSEKYHLSLRPYPTEPRETYDHLYLCREGRLHIDDSFDFSTWLLQQDIVIGDYSSTLAQIVASKTKYINIANIVPRSNDLYMFALIDLFKKFTQKNSPNSVDELVDMILNDKVQSLHHPELTTLFENLYTINTKKSTLYTIANKISTSLSKLGAHPGPSIPLWLVKRLCSIRYKKAGPSYSFIDESKISQEHHREIDLIAANILEHSGSLHP